MDGRLVGWARCGAPVTGGRFCANCGVVDSGAGAAQRETTFGSLGETPRQVAPVPDDHPPYGRPAQPAYSQPSQEQPEYAAPPVYDVSASQPTPPRASPGMGLWIGAGALLLAVLMLGSWLLLHGPGGSTATSSKTASLGGTGLSRVSPSPSSSSPSSSAPSSASPTPAHHGPAQDVAGLARASAPTHSAPAVDLDGRPVTYVPANMVDGAADTSWRTPGNATNTVLTFRLDQPTRLTRVGLINGYAKIAYAGGSRYDWYQGNRRVLVVTWMFDDGTTIGQHLTNTMSMQTMSVRPVTTRTVRLRIDAVSPPGPGPASRDETAVSEVSLVGRTA